MSTIPAGPDPTVAAFVARHAVAIFAVLSALLGIGMGVDELVQIHGYELVQVHGYEVAR